MGVVWCEVDVAEVALRMRASYGDEARPVLVAGRGVVPLADARSLLGYGEGALHPMDAAWLTWSVEAQGNPAPLDPRQATLFNMTAFERRVDLVIPEALQGIATGECMDGVDECALWFLVCMGVALPPIGELDDDALDTLYSEGFLCTDWQGCEPLHDIEPSYDDYAREDSRWTVAYEGTYNRYEPIGEDEESPCTCGARNVYRCDCEAQGWVWVETWNEASSRAGALSVEPLEVGTFGERTEWECVWYYARRTWHSGDCYGGEESEQTGLEERWIWRDIMDGLYRKEAQDRFISHLEWYVPSPLGDGPYRRHIVSARATV